jgi:hypothetical protein
VNIAGVFVVTRPDRLLFPFAVTIQAETGKGIEFPSNISDADATKAFTDYYAERTKENVFNQFDVPANVVDVEVRKLHAAIRAEKITLQTADRQFVIWGVLPPIGLLVFGFISAWTVQGFESTKS